MRQGIHLTIAVLAVAVACFVALGCGGGGDDSPEEAARGFFEAGAKGSDDACDHATDDWELLPEGTSSATDLSCEERVGEGTEIALKNAGRIEDVEAISKSKDRVRVRLDAANETYVLDVVKEDGGWRVDRIGKESAVPD